MHIVVFEDYAALVKGDNGTFTAVEDSVEHEPVLEVVQ